MGFSRQEYWSRLPFPSPGDLPGPGNKLVSPALQVDSLPLELPEKPLLSTVRMLKWLKVSSALFEHLLSNNAFYNSVSVY